ncbi:MAG: hypothetical protein KDH09_17125 [Chrysiogenetes bacterium]|nr:hypothetical protein [Chrysiogenetes bacterium]
MSANSLRTVMISSGRAAGVLALLAVLVIGAACERAPERPGPGVYDKVALFEAMQSSRIEQTIKRLNEEHDLSVLIRAQTGGPLGEDSLLKGLGEEALVLDFYPQAKTFEMHIATNGGSASAIDRTWEARLRTRTEPAWGTPGRVGDVLELWLRQLSETLGSRAVNQSLLPQEIPGTPDPAKELEDIDWSTHAAPPAWEVSKDPTLPQPSPNEAYAAFIEVARRQDTRGDLELYTPDSRDNFKKYPMSATQLARLYKKYAAAPYELAVLNDRAVAHFPTQPRTFIPYFFVRGIDGWQIDFYTSAKVITMEVGAEWRFEIQDHPYMFGFSKYLTDERGWVLYGENVR